MLQENFVRKSHHNKYNFEKLILFDCKMLDFKIMSPHLSFQDDFLNFYAFQNRLINLFVFFPMGHKVTTFRFSKYSRLYFFQDEYINR